jgi:hypothetical protein
LVPPPKHTLNDLPLDVLANHIFSFVGDYQYRFVGGVSRHFENAYRQTFPMKTTQYRMNTIQHAKLCWSEVPKNDRPLLQRIAKQQIWERLGKLQLLGRFEE